MKRHFDAAGYDVQDDEGGRSNRRVAVVAAVVAAVLAVSGTLGVALVSRGRQAEAEAKAVQAQFVASSGQSGDVDPDDLSAILPIANQALAGNLPDPTGAQAGDPPAQLIPARVLQAYRASEEQVADEVPSCHLPWWVLAGAGKVASDHAAGGQVNTAGVTSVRILGPRLDGRAIGTSIVRDTDKGRLDGDLTFDRGVGPMLILPSSWTSLGVDGNGDGLADVHNVDDAARTVGAILCAAGGDLRKPESLARAVLTLHPAPVDASDVLAWGAYYRRTLEAGSPTASPSPSPAQPLSPSAPAAAQPRSLTPRYTTVPTTTARSTSPPVGTPAPPITARPVRPARPTAPSARPTAPSARPTAPSARPTAPSARPTAPSARPTAPSARPTAPSARPSQSASPTNAPSPTGAPPTSDVPSASLPAATSDAAVARPSSNAPIVQSASSRIGDAPAPQSTTRFEDASVREASSAADAIDATE